MRRFLGASILSLMLAMGVAHADDAWFRLDLSAPIIFGSGGPPSSGTNDNIAFAVVGETDKRVDGSLSLTVTVTGVGANHSISVAGLPSGAIWTPDPITYGAGTITWLAATEGSHDLTVDVRDSVGTIVASQAIEVTVYPLLAASVAETSYEATVRETLAVTPNADNAIGAVLWESTPSPLPDWLHLDADTGVIEVDTSAAHTLSDIVLTAVDQADAMTANTLPFSITVNKIMTDYWVATLGGSKNDGGYGIVAGADGSLYVMGYTNSAGAGGTDVLVVKYNASGALQWKKTLGGAGTEGGRGIIAGADGSLYVTGYTANTGAGGYDMLVAKYNTNGALQWKKTLGGTGNDYGYGIVAGTDGSLYVTGYTTSVGAGGNDMLTAKYNASGVLQWRKTLGGTGDDYGMALAAGSDGSIYVTGYTTSAGASDMLVAKYNANGALQWQKTLGGTGTDDGYGITAGSDGSLYVTGSTASAGAGGNDMLVVKYNASGALQWQKTLGATGSDYGRGVASGPNGSLYVTGYTTSTGAGGYDLLVAPLPSTDEGPMSAGSFTFEDADLTVGENPNMTVGENPNLTDGQNPTGLTVGTADSLADATTEFEKD